MLSNYHYAAGAGTVHIFLLEAWNFTHNLPCHQLCNYWVVSSKVRIIQVLFFLVDWSCSLPHIVSHLMSSLPWHGNNYLFDNMQFLHNFMYWHCSISALEFVLIMILSIIIKKYIVCFLVMVLGVGHVQFIDH